MPVQKSIPYRSGIFFITFTCYQWLPLIEITVGYDLVYKWFDHLKKQGHYITGYQLMPNHVHCLLAFRNSERDINLIIGNGKRFIGYGIIKRLKKSKQQDVLNKLAQGVNYSDRKRGKQHEIWENSFDWKHCYNKKMILQKLEYIHNNVCKGKWQLVENPVDYTHSSAKFYSTGEHGIYAVTSFMELEDVDLTIRS